MKDFTPFFAMAFVILFFCLTFYVALRWAHRLSLRSKKAKEIARKYGLKYSEYKWSLGNFGPTTVKMNFIEGELNGRNILIYDKYPNRGMLSIASSTMVIIDGVEKPRANVISGTASLEEIDSILSKLAKR